MKIRPLVLFDGVCNLCNGTVDFILKRDGKKQFRFVALQSEAGEKIREKF
ncbi:MAG: thiol-disulfide oxidoreductase DCC family protein, partial [Mariniphaga sp.]